SPPNSPGSHNATPDALTPAPSSSTCASKAAAGWQLEQPSEVNSSTTTAARLGTDGLAYSPEPAAPTPNNPISNVAPIALRLVNKRLIDLLQDTNEPPTDCRITAKIGRAHV